MTDWGETLNRFGPMVWRTVNRLVRDVADSEDCFQEAFASAWKYSQRHEVRDWPALLRWMATARALERVREQVRRRTRFESWPAAGVIDPRASDPAQVAQNGELEELLRRALAEIKPQEAAVFCLVCLEGLSYGDVAGQLDLTVNHVGVVLNRARSRLRTILGHTLPGRVVPPLPEKSQ